MSHSVFGNRKRIPFVKRRRLFLIESLERRCMLTQTLSVTTAEDLVDGDPTTLSLREAITQAAQIIAADNGETDVYELAPELDAGGGIRILRSSETVEAEPYSPGRRALALRSARASPASPRSFARDRLCGHGLGFRERAGRPAVGPSRACPDDRPSFQGRGPGDRPGRPV